VHEEDSHFMMLALKEAEAAEAAGEVPVGAVIVLDGKMVARGHNRTMDNCDPTAHAEVIALRQAAQKLANYRLTGATLYVTIEPCAMCAGAMIQARVARLVYGCEDPKGGAIVSCFEMADHPKLNHRMEVTPGVLAEDCARTVRDFFEKKRDAL